MAITYTLTAHVYVETENALAPNAAQLSAELNVLIAQLNATIDLWAPPTVTDTSRGTATVSSVNLSGGRKRQRIDVPVVFTFVDGYVGATVKEINEGASLKNALAADLRTWIGGRSPEYVTGSGLSWEESVAQGGQTKSWRQVLRGL